MARKTTSTPKKSSTRKSTAARKELPALTKPSRPAIGAGTWITLIVLAIFISGAYYLNYKKEADANAEPTPTFEVPTFVFPEDSIVTSIEIKPLDGETVKVARNEENVWAVELPIELEADQGTVEAAASQITALAIDTELDPNDDPSIFGFDEPAFVITVEFKDGKKQTLEVGDTTPSEGGYYVRLDGKKMMVVGLSGIDALTSLALFPPYLNTPTPTALPATPTPVPPPTETASPEATPTP